MVANVRDLRPFVRPLLATPLPIVALPTLALPTLALLTLTLLTLALVTPAPAQSSSPPATSTPADPAAVVATHLPEMKRLLRTGIERKKPNDNLWKQHPGATVFDGSYDWHSCVSAHWAALSMARATDDPELAQWVLARLTPAALEAERNLRNIAYLDAEAAAALDPPPPKPTRPPARNRPYIDTWTLLLLDELRRHEGQDTPALRAFRLDTERRLLEHLEQTPFPEVAPTERLPHPLVFGHYRSWLWAYLMLCLVPPQLEDGAERLQRLRTTKLDPQRQRLATYDRSLAADFFDVRSLYALVVHYEPAGTDGAPAKERPTPRPPLEPPEQITLSTCHQLGVMVSMTWPDAALASSDDAARRRLHTRTAEFLGQPQLWSEGFVTATHWVPQFVWFGLWLGRGRP